MLEYGYSALIIALGTGLLGFSGIAREATAVAKLFLVIAAVAFLLMVLGVSVR